jgi:hypothetical protein
MRWVDGRVAVRSRATSEAHVSAFSSTYPGTTPGCYVRHLGEPLTTACRLLHGLIA